MNNTTSQVQIKPYQWLLIISMLVSFVFVNFVGPGQARKQIIDGDGSGYYAYLPALVIYQTLDFTPVFEWEKSRRSKDYQGHYFHQEEEILINKYTAGTALLQLPFFLLACLISFIFGLPVDGYNVVFQYTVALATIGYVYLGLIFFKRLADLFQIPSRIGIFLVFAGLFGTNLFHYTFLAPSMSHAYSFALISIFLFNLKILFIQYNTRQVAVSAFLLGLVVLVRPVNFVVALAVPFIAASPGILLSSIRARLKNRDFVVATGFFVLALLPQLFINFLQMGKPVVDGYANEGFYWSNPEMLKFLFSYRKGWFVYTPFMLLIIPSTILLYRKSIYALITFLVFLLALVYVFSAWWNWLYGDSLGMRPMIDFYALFLLVIGFFFLDLKIRWMKVTIVVFTAACIFLNIFQTWQYANGILHPDSMNRKAYWYIFLKTADRYAGSIGDHDEYFYGKLSKQPIFKTDLHAGRSVPIGWSKPVYHVRPENDSTYFKLDQEIIYSPAYTSQIEDSLQGRKDLYVMFHTLYRENLENAALGALFVVDISGEKDNLLFYKAFRTKRLPDEVTGQWREAHIGFKLPEITPEMRRLKLYIWNQGKQPLDLREIGIRFYTYGY